MRLFGKMGSIDERLSEDPALMALCRGFSSLSTRTHFSIHLSTWYPGQSREDGLGDGQADGPGGLAERNNAHAAAK
jgi:hypothetical protein